MSLVTTSVAVICQSRELRAPIACVLADDARVRLSDIHRVDDLPLDEPGRSFPDVLVIHLDDMRRLSPELAIRIARRATIVIALGTGDILQLSTYATVADSWLFLDDQVPLSTEIVLFGLIRYCVVPGFVSPAFSATGVRQRLIGQLTDVEQMVLEGLGAGAANREIADRLALSETSVKYLVRSVLKKLHLPNRTRAAVLVHSAALEVSSTVPIDRGEGSA